MDQTIRRWVPAEGVPSTARRACRDHPRIGAASLALLPGFASRLCPLVPVRSERAAVTGDTRRLFRLSGAFGVDAAVVLLGAPEMKCVVPGECPYRVPQLPRRS
jgi:hypothetical protein